LALIQLGGFANEESVCEKFNSWRSDSEAQLWLGKMGYSLDEIENVVALRIPRSQKADIQIKILITVENLTMVENLSLKKANNDANYNQVDKRWVDTYREMWGFDEDITRGLKLFTGEVEPDSSIIGSLRDKRRMFLDELSEDLSGKIVDFFKENKTLVASDILRGRGALSADWMLVTRYNKADDTTTWALQDINTAINFFAKGDVYITKRGSLKIRRITMQRKGGDAGRKTARMLQFKIKPCDLFVLGW